MHVLHPVALTGSITVSMCIQMLAVISPEGPAENRSIEAVPPVADHG